MFEGAQGTMLDIDHGTYPFVTSSSATSGGAAIGTGVPPNAIDTIIGMSKAYCTRVGGGPFPTEVQGSRAKTCANAATNTARSQDVRAAAAGSICLYSDTRMINGVNWWVVTKLDVLDELDEVPVCVGYKINGKKTESIPALATGFETVECIYEKMPGWKTSTEGITSFEKLPKKAQNLSAISGEGSGSEDRHGFNRTGPRSDHVHAGI